MWKLLVVLSIFAVAQGCRLIEQKANGIEQSRQAFPSLVLLEPFVTFKQSYMCSGVLINADHVLTTANCVFGAEFVNVHVYAHKVRDVFEAEREIYRSTEYFMKPEFDGNLELNDVALVKLPLTLNLVARPYAVAQLPGNNVFLTAGTEGNVVGWGLLNFKDDNAASIKHAQTMRVISDADCRAAHPGHWQNEENYEGRVCIQRTTGINCVSDSGSPFMIGDVVYGLLSFGQQEACNNGSPNGIQEVRHHLAWINDNIGDLAPWVLFFYIVKST